jgi:hypothetical protein
MPLQIPILQLSIGAEIFFKGKQEHQPGLLAFHRDVAGHGPGEHHANMAARNEHAHQPWMSNSSLQLLHVVNYFLGARDVNIPLVLATRQRR